MGVAQVRQVERSSKNGRPTPGPVGAAMTDGRSTEDWGKDGEKRGADLRAVKCRKDKISIERTKRWGERPTPGLGSIAETK